MTIYIVAVFFSMGGFWHFSTYTTAKEACLDAMSDESSHHFKARMTKEGKIVFMEDLKCRVTVEVQNP